MGLWYAAQLAAIVALTLACARACRADRNYWPMMVVIFTAIAATYGGALVGNLLGGTDAIPAPVPRLVFNGVMILAMGYARWFIGKRNRTKRWARVALNGHVEFRPVEEMEMIALLAESWANHGEMPPATMARLRLALDQGERRQPWIAEQQRRLDARRARRRGIPDGAGEGER